MSSTYQIAGVTYRGIIIQKPDVASAPRGVMKSFWASSVTYPKAGNYHLATFEDDENIEAAVAECMGVILRAIEQNATVCDLMRLFVT